MRLYILSPSLLNYTHHQVPVNEQYAYNLPGSNAQPKKSLYIIVYNNLGNIHSIRYTIIKKPWAFPPAADVYTDPNSPYNYKDR